MLTNEEASDSWWAFELARFGASPSVIAACCGRTRKWAKHLIEGAGADTAKHRPVNRRRAFERGPYRKAHAHVVVRIHFEMKEAARAPKRLALLYGAYRMVSSPAILSIDEVHELVFNVLVERGADSRVCSLCRQTWYLVGESCATCPACEALVVYVCAKCGGAVDREKGKRGRPTHYCDNCRDVRRRQRPSRARRAQSQVSDRQLRLVGFTSPDGSEPPIVPPTLRASRSGR